MAVSNVPSVADLLGPIPILEENLPLGNLRTPLYPVDERLYFLRFGSGSFRAGFELILGRIYPDCHEAIRENCNFIWADGKLFGQAEKWFGRLCVDFFE